jgi:hypothetical protein
MSKQSKNRSGYWHRRRKKFAALVAAPAANPTKHIYVPYQVGGVMMYRKVYLFK